MLPRWGEKKAAEVSSTSAEHGASAKSEPETPPVGSDWNADGFATRVAQAKLAKDFGLLKKTLAEVAEDNYKLRACWRVPRTVAISYDQCIDYAARGGRGKPAEISFSTMDTIEAMLHFAADRRRVVCALNFANGKDVGGGYKNGSTAQEEDLCRRIPALYTSLYRAAKDGMYPFGPSTCSSVDAPEKYADVLYTANLIVAREGEEGGFGVLPRERQVQVSLVAAAAPNMRFANDINDPELIYRTIQTIFLAPRMIQKEVTTLILGAWGCGAFGGQPAEIAQLFVQALIRDNLGQSYRDIHFAIPRTCPTDANYDTFRDVFRAC
mmetsp:Transcript_47437/g.91693  ORF Transcript_47437/g.91693 Transcript_47437/m.91693 type:complete len:324 (-) Transcript_47437:19-990(-)